MGILNYKTWLKRLNVAVLAAALLLPTTFALAAGPNFEIRQGNNRFDVFLNGARLTTVRPRGNRPITFTINQRRLTQLLVARGKFDRQGIRDADYLRGSLTSFDVGGGIDVDRRGRGAFRFTLPNDFNSFGQKLDTTAVIDPRRNGNRTITIVNDMVSPS